MAITKYESYYKKIHEQVETIRKNNEYKTESIAFAHWYLSQYYKLSLQEITEAVVDGKDDLGIDAVLLDEINQSLTIMQFKFPSKVETINKEIDQGSILKTWNGFEMLVSNERIYTGENTKFKEIKDQLKDMFIQKFRIVFVSYNKGIVENINILNDKQELFFQNTGSSLEILYHNRDMISNLYERLNRKNNIRIKLKYKQMQSAYNVKERGLDSYVGFASGVDVVEAISEDISTIFDENIRLFEFGSDINSGINRTATSSSHADMFYFYNNGIVFICDKATNSPASNEIELDGASVVNGCQTLNVLYNAKQKNELNNNTCLLVRIIVISDYSERMRITEYLNSQTPIRSSYFIANHSIVRDLQKELLAKGYFLERQVNEYEFMKTHGGDIQDKIVLQLESVIQYYVGYWNNQYASLAKRGKNALFDKNKIEDILSGISATAVIESVSIYRDISEVLTMYRKTRRNREKTEFATYMGVEPKVVLDHIDEFKYMHTGDIILMNAFADLKSQYNKIGVGVLEEKFLIQDAIMLVREIVMQEVEENTSLITKNSAVFAKMQKKINGLRSRYMYTW